MKLIILTQYYPPETGGPQNRLSDLAKCIVRMGHQVTVLTAMPNYPTGMIYPGYRRKIYMRETIEGVLVHRSWIFAVKSRRALPRLANYFSFMLSSLICGAFCLGRADFLLTASPALLLGIPGYVLSKLKGARFVLHVSDLWPKAAAEVKVVTNKWLINGALRLEKFLYRRAALVTTPTQSMVLEIQRCVPQTNVRLLTNGADTDQFQPHRGQRTLLAEFGLEGRFIVGYGGIHGLAQALNEVVDAGVYLMDFPDIVIAFFGDGPIKSELEQRARGKRLKNVRFFSLQPRERMPGLVALWSVGLVPLFNSVLGSVALPAKMFEIMAAGVPVLLSAPTGEASCIIEAAQGGVCVEPENPRTLAEAIIKLYQNPAWRLELGQNARRHVERYYNREVITHQFLQYLLELDNRGLASQVNDQASTLSPQLLNEPNQYVSLDKVKRL